MENKATGTFIGSFSLSKGSKTGEGGSRFLCGAWDGSPGESSMFLSPEYLRDEPIRTQCHSEAVIAPSIAKGDRWTVTLHQS